MCIRDRVDTPHEVFVSRANAEAGSTIHLRVAPADIGKVVGRQGRTARSLRTILNAAASKSNQRLSLEIVE